MAQSVCFGSVAIGKIWFGLVWAGFRSSQDIFYRAGRGLLWKSHGPDSVFCSVAFNMVSFGLVRFLSGMVQSGKALLLVRSGLSDTVPQFVHLISAGEKIF